MFNSEWYQLLNKPPLTPSAEIFPAAWGILYSMMLFSLILFIRTPSRQDKIKGYILFVTQVILNIIWSPTFFVAKNINIALLIIILLDITVFFNIKEFFKTSKISGFLLVPYFIWILFATYLNSGFIYLNPNLNF